MQQLTVLHTLADMIVRHSASLMTKAVSDACKQSLEVKPLKLNFAEQVFVSGHPLPVLKEVSRSHLLDMAPRLAEVFQRLIKHRMAFLAESSFGIKRESLAKTSLGLHMRLVGDKDILEEISLGKMISLAETICDGEFRLLVAQQIELKLGENDYANPFTATVFVKTFDASFRTIFSNADERHLLMSACIVGFVRRLKEFIGFFSMQLDSMLEEAVRKQVAGVQTPHNSSFACTEPMDP